MRVWIERQCELFGRGLVLIHHIGAKTGEQRVAPARAFREGPDAWLVAASKAGAPDNPAWYHNLTADPGSVQVQDGPEPFDVTVREVEGDERAEWWARAVAVFPNYAEYQTKTDRQIPVLVASPR